MKIFIPIRRASLLIPSTGPWHDPSRAHLFVILTDICPDKLHLLVPINSVHLRCDRSCILMPGDHDFIVRESFVNYALAAKYEAAILQKRVGRGEFVYRGIVDEDVFERICGGLLVSPYTTPAVLTYFKENTPN